MYRVTSLTANYRNNSNNNTDYTAQQKKFLVPCFLGLFLGLFGALIQKNALDRLHQL
jgi:H+/Cl- antiporter ClcA